jgi:hypothetical protein
MLGDQIKDKDAKVNLNKGSNDIVHSKQITNAQAQDDTLHLILQKYPPLTHAFLFSSETLQCHLYYYLCSIFFVTISGWRASKQCLAECLPRRKDVLSFSKSMRRQCAFFSYRLALCFLFAGVVQDCLPPSSRLR